jgi:flagellar biosynthetic protein FliR
MDQLLAQVPLLLLVFSRIAGVAAVSPVFANQMIQPALRGAFTILLGVVMLPVARGHVAPNVLTGSGLLAGCVLELLVGLVIGFVGQMTFAAVQMAGSLIDLDMGFLTAQIFDPATGKSEPLTTIFFQSLTLAIYLAVNAHHWLIRALAQSFETIPVGGLTTAVTAPLHVATVFGTMIAVAVQMVLPFTAVMLLASLAMAGITRAVPQMHIFAVGMGAKAVAGMAFLMLLIPYLLTMIEKLFAAGQSELLNVLQMMR